MTLKMMVLVPTLLLSTLAQAVCYRDGRPYPTGAEVNGYICMADGTWKKK